MILEQRGCALAGAQEQVAFISRRDGESHGCLGVIRIRADHGFIQGAGLTVVIERLLRISQFFLNRANLAVTERYQPDRLRVRCIRGRQTF